MMHSELERQQTRWQAKYRGKLTPHNVTSAHVQEFARYMLDTYDARILAKADSAIMRIAGGVLQAVGAVNREDFLARFTTTVGRTIWAPFTLGEEAGGDSWSLWSQIITITHECQHIAQDTGKRSQTVIEDRAFKRKYLVVPRFRLEAELEAYACNIALSYWYYGRTPSPRALANLLRSYKLSEARIDLAEQAFEAHANSVRAGVITPGAAQLAIAWLETYAPELRHPDVAPYKA